MSRKECLINVCLSYYDFPEKNNGRLNMKTSHNVHNIILGTGKLRRTLTQPAGVIDALWPTKISIRDVR